MTRILIADDSPPMRCGLRTFLEPNSEWQVCGEAVDGADAIRKAQQLAPDLIVMDFSMPKMDGVEVVREIARSGTDIPILLLTLHLSPQIIESAGRSRFNKGAVAHKAASGDRSAGAVVRLTFVLVFRQNCTTEGWTPQCLICSRTHRNNNLRVWSHRATQVLQLGGVSMWLLFRALS